MHRTEVCINSLSFCFSEPRHLFAALAPNTKFYVAPVPAILNSKQTFLKRMQVSIKVRVLFSDCLTEETPSNGNGKIK
jgi:hypothetical protein